MIRSNRRSLQVSLSTLVALILSVVIAGALLAAVPALQSENPKLELQPLSTLKPMGEPSTPTEHVAKPGPAKPDVPADSESIPEPEGPVAHDPVPSPAPGDEIVGLRTETTKTYATATPNELRVVAFSGPVHFKNGAGHWQEINDNLVVDAKGDAEPKAHGRDARFAAKADADELAWLDLGAGRSVSYGLRGGRASSERQIAGRKATYVDALPSVNVELESLPVAVKEALVLASADVPTTYTFDLKTDGVTPVLVDAGRRVELRDGDKKVAEIPAGFMTDASVSEYAGLPARSDDVSYALDRVGNKWRLTVSLDAAWLKDSARVFPVRVDPTVTPLSVSQDDTYAAAGHSAAFDSADVQLSVGYCDKAVDPMCGSSNFESYAYLQFNFASLPGTHTITSAALNLYQNHAAYSCVASDTEVQTVSAPWNPATLDWTNKPADGSHVTTLSTNAGNGCPNAWVAFDVSSVANAYRQGTIANNGFRLNDLLGADMHGWKKFASNNDANPALRPNVTYTITNNPPNVPTWVAPASGAWYTTGNPTLQASYSDPDGDPGQVAFHLVNTESGVEYGWTPTSSNGVIGNVASGATASWTPTGLPDGLYRWTAHADDYGSNSQPMADRYFGIGAKPTFTKSLTPGQPVRANVGELQSFRLTATNPSSLPMTIYRLVDNFGTAFVPATPRITYSGTNLPATSTCGAGCVLDTATNILTIGGLPNNGVLAPGATIYFDVPAVVSGTDADPCGSPNNASGMYSSRLNIASNLAAITACDAGLGREAWWQFVNTDIGPASWAGVNVANGNLVLQQADTTPIQSAGRLALGTVRTYNSLSAAGYQMPTGFAKGWSLNAMDSSLGVPAGLSFATTNSVTAPNPITMVDADGTRHVFGFKGLGAAVALPVPLDVPISVNGVVDTIKASAGFMLCVDQTFKAPAGVHLGLFRYVQVPTTDGCANLASASIVGYAAVRPDRTRYEFNTPYGQVTAVRDPSGNVIKYANEAPGGGNLFGRLLREWEPSATCTDGTQATCRALRIAYDDPAGTMTVTDPAGRVTKYTLNGKAGIPTSLLQSVQLPDGPAGALGSIITYTYGGCAGAASNQLCAVTDPRGGTTRFSYVAGPSGGPARIEWMGSRRSASLGDAYSTKFAYQSGSTDVTRDGTLRRFQNIDSDGRVGRILEGTAAGSFMHDTTYSWDTSSSSCIQPDTKVDNNLCSIKRVGIASGAPDQTTIYTYTAEGLPLIERKVEPVNGDIVTTWGYKTQAVRTGTTQVFNDSSGGNGTITSTGTGPRDTADTMFTVSDNKEMLSPKGNSGGAILPFLTVFRRDNNSAVAPGAAATSNPCATPTSPSSNTGVLCEAVTPYTGTAWRSTKYRYDLAGRRIEMTTPKESADNATVKTTYTYYSGTELDLSATKTASGWLKAETDPAGQFVVFAYDAAGNVARTWDRNATAPVAGTFPATSTQWENAATPPTSQYAETRYGSGTAAFSAPWRYPLSSRNAAGETTTFAVDANGNATRIRPPKGNNGTPVTTFDRTYTFDAADNLTSKNTPNEAAASTSWRYVYDARDNLVAIADPTAASNYPASATTSSNGHVRTFTYDAVNRPVQQEWTRGLESDMGKPAACRTTGSGDAPLPSGRVACHVARSYAGTDAVISSTDGEGQTTTYVYDAAGRQTRATAPRLGGVTLRTDTVYDLNSNVVRVCSPRQFDTTEPNNTSDCQDTALYATHNTYWESNELKTTKTYEDSTAITSTSMTSYTYDPDGNTISVTDPRGFVTSATFDYLDRRVSLAVPRTASTFNTTQYSYDKSGNTTAITDPTNRVTAYSYDSVNRLVDTVTGSDNLVAASAGTATGTTNTRTKVLYDLNGNTVATYQPNAFNATTGGSVANPDERFMIRVDYDNDDQPVARWTPRFDTADANRNGFTTGTSIQKTQCPVGAAGTAGTVPAYPATVGVCVTKTDYDPAGRVITSWMPTAVGTGSASRKVTFAYTDDNLLWKQSAPDPRTDGVATQATTTLIYDGAGRQVQSYDPLNRVTLIGYTADGLVQSVAAPDGPLTKHTAYATYNANGQRVKQVDPANYIQGSPDTSPATVSAYTSNGRLRSLTDELSNITRYEYDLNGNPLKVYAPNDVAAGGTSRATFNYFTADNLLDATAVATKTDLSQWRRTEYVYDGAGRQTSERPWLATGSGRNATTTGSDGAISYTFANNGRNTVDTSRVGETITRTFDPSGALIGLSSNAGAATSSTATYYLDGALRSWADTGAGATLDDNRYEYNAAGQQTLRVEQGPLDSGWVERGRTTTTYADAGGPRQLTNSRVTGSWAWTYDLAGRAKQINAANGQATQLDWNTDDTLRQAFLSRTPGSTAAADLITSNTYTYDNGYRLTQNVKAATTGVAGTGTQSYHYDTAGRVDKFTNLANTLVSYQWDRNSNRTNDGTNAYVYNPDNSIASRAGTAYTYKPFGGLATDECGSFAYDGFDREKTAPARNNLLACVLGSSQATVSDGLGRGWKATVGAATSTFGYDGPSQNLARQDVAGTRVSYLLDSVGGPLGTQTDTTVSPTTRYSFGDGQGNTTTLYATSACTVSYTPFGDFDGAASTACVGTAANQRWYQSSQRSASTGSYRFGSRTYQPGTATFTTPDSMAGAGSTANLSIGVDPLTQNRYGYVNGDPVNYWDPSGHGLCVRPNRWNFPTIGWCPTDPVTKAVNKATKKVTDTAKKAEKKVEKKVTETIDPYLHPARNYANAVNAANGCGGSGISNGPPTGPCLDPSMADEVDSLVVPLTINLDLWWLQAGVELAIIPESAIEIDSALTAGRNGASDLSTIGDSTSAGSAMNAAESGGPVQQAAAAQSQAPYGGVDEWESVTLKAGTIVHAGEPGLSGFATSDAVASAVGSDATALNQGLQIADRAGTYRPGLTAFRLTQDVAAARSIALANTQFGPGGFEQFFIPDFEKVAEPWLTRLMFGGAP